MDNIMIQCLEIFESMGTAEAIIVVAVLAILFLMSLRIIIPIGMMIFGAALLAILKTAEIMCKVWRKWRNDK
jgi:hypothetical protein